MQTKNNCSLPTNWYPACPQAAATTSWPTPPVHMLSMTSYGIEYPFGQYGSAIQAVSPPTSLCTSSLFAGRAWEAEKSLN